MADFKLTMEFYWSKDGTFEDLGRTEGVVFREKPGKKSKAPPVEDEAEESSNEEEEDQDDEEVEDEEMESDDE